MMGDVLLIFLKTNDNIQLLPLPFLQTPSKPMIYVISRRFSNWIGYTVWNETERWASRVNRSCPFEGNILHSNEETEESEEIRCPPRATVTILLGVPACVATQRAPRSLSVPSTKVKIGWRYICTSLYVFLPRQFCLLHLKSFITAMCSLFGQTYLEAWPTALEIWYKIRLQQADKWISSVIWITEQQM
jgi:hypothetical protein